MKYFTIIKFKIIKLINSTRMIQMLTLLHSPITSTQPNLAPSPPSLPPRLLPSSQKPDDCNQTQTQFTEFCKEYDFQEPTCNLLFKLSEHASNPLTGSTTKCSYRTAMVALFQAGIYNKINQRADNLTQYDLEMLGIIKSEPEVINKPLAVMHSRNAPPLIINNSLIFNAPIGFSAPVHLGGYLGKYRFILIQPPTNPTSIYKTYTINRDENDVLFGADGWHVYRGTQKTHRSTGDCSYRRAFIQFMGKHEPIENKTRWSTFLLLVNQLQQDVNISFFHDIQPTLTLVYQCILIGIPEELEPTVTTRVDFDLIGNESLSNRNSNNLTVLKENQLFFPSTIHDTQYPFYSFFTREIPGTDPPPLPSSPPPQRPTPPHPAPPSLPPIAPPQAPPPFSPEPSDNSKILILIITCGLSIVTVPLIHILLKRYHNQKERIKHQNSQRIELERIGAENFL